MPEFIASQELYEELLDLRRGLEDRLRDQLARHNLAEVEVVARQIADRMGHIIPAVRYFPASPSLRLRLRRAVR